MKVDRVFHKFERTLERWRSRLDALPEESFARPPPDGGWSIGQICSHVALASDLLLAQAAICARGEGERKGFQIAPAAITLVGSLPPVRLKVPPGGPPDWEELADPKPLTKERALERLDRMEKRMRDLRPEVHAAPATMRTKHFAAGWMNAGQWYQFAEMHFRHHLRQLRRTRKPSVRRDHARRRAYS